jgi:hypothetical protein
MDCQGATGSRKEVRYLGIGNIFSLFRKCSLAQELAEGRLVEVCKDWWPRLSKGIPIVATPELVSRYGGEGLIVLVWEPFVAWCRTPEGRRRMIKDDEFTIPTGGETARVILELDAFVEGPVFVIDVPEPG